jgi:hypothetical protein
VMILQAGENANGVRSGPHSRRRLRHRPQAVVALNLSRKAAPVLLDIGERRIHLSHVLAQEGPVVPRGRGRADGQAKSQRREQRCHLRSSVRRAFRSAVICSKLRFLLRYSL